MAPGAVWCDNGETYGLPAGTTGRATKRQPVSGTTRLLVLGIVVLLLLIGAVVLVVAFTDDGLGFGLLDDDLSARTAYLAVFLFIAGDALFPIFPGESTLNAAAVMASNDTLELGPVIVAGALGAIVGDNALYWIARGSRKLVEGQIERLQQDSRVQWLMRFLGARAPMVIVFGRYLPGMRFFVNASMGILPLPYRQFLLWTVIGGVLWSTYTSLLAYYVGNALEGYPLASMIIAGAITTALIAIIYWLDVRRGAKTRSGEAAEPESAKP
jgi:membrane protein DedA with SNARE-associated domain